MFGILNSADRDVERLFSVLDRSESINSIKDLRETFSAPEREDIGVARCAIGIDSSVFLRLADHKDVEDIVDYFKIKHEGGLILPGQSIQEFWNNHLTAAGNVSQQLKSGFKKLRETTEKLEPDFSFYSERFSELIREMELQYGFFYDEETRRKTRDILGFLEEAAFVSHVSRSRFSDLADYRHKTKTPPGYQDSGNGDFFVWAEFLRGLQIRRKADKPFDKAVIVTLDKKKDWSQSGFPHPVLSAEVNELVGVPFELWDLKQLAKEIGAA